MLKTKEVDPNLLEAEFYNKPFKFSYSSLNKLLETPSVFYKEYILKEKDDDFKKYLLEGILIHFLVLENQNFDERFLVIPDKLPSDNVIAVVKHIHSLYAAEENPDPKNKLGDYRDEILNQLKEMDYYQNLKDTSNGTGDDKRIAKIVEPKAEAYFKFLKKQQGRDIIDSEMLDRCTRRAEIVKANPQMRDLLGLDLLSDFKTFGIYNELYIEKDEEDYPFGFKGVVDNIVVDVDNRVIRINDFKTTSKELTKFSDSVEYWNYWLQAAMYEKLVCEFFKNVMKESSEWKIEFRFIVFDRHNQLYAFKVQDSTMEEWKSKLKYVEKQADYHYKSKDFTLPYEYALGYVKL